MTRFTVDDELSSHRFPEELPPAPGLDFPGRPAPVPGLVLDQVVGAHKAAAAEGAGEGLGACVRPAVARKLVRADEAFGAALERTRVGTLSYEYKGMGMFLQ